MAKSIKAGTIGGRILEITEKLDLTLYEFAKRMGQDPGFLYKFRNKKVDPSVIRLYDIKDTYRFIDLNWVVFGEGEMFTRPLTADDLKKPKRVEKINKDQQKPGIENTLQEILKRLEDLEKGNKDSG